MVDIDEWSSYSDNNRNIDGIIFTKIKINHYHSKTNFSWSKMVIHHVENIDLLMKELHRILKDNGIIYVEEHNAVDDFDYMLCDIEHGLFACTIDNDFKYFYNEYYAKYYDHLELTYMFEKYNFNYLDGNALFYYYKPEVTPTSKHWALYSKK